MRKPSDHGAMILMGTKMAATMCSIVEEIVAEITDFDWDGDTVLWILRYGHEELGLGVDNILV